MRIDNPCVSDIPTLWLLWQEAFGDSDNFINDFFSTAFHTDRCLCLRLDSQIVATLYWFDCLYQGRKLAYIYGIATGKEFRNQGLCHRLLMEAHIELARLGYQGTILVPGNGKLFEMYKHMRYETCCYIREFSCQSVAGSLTLWQIDKSEYASLRRQFLPTGSVIQERENLDFLETQASFYAGDNFLLTARNEACHLIGLELLGDYTVAPQILHALGYTNGSFRTPDGNIPFAMYRAIGSRPLAPPSYFGLAFD